ncbi:N-acetylmuramoyl-L-alanine amidase [Thalassobaculum litoreum]|uniref:N-acetylmuramoyl-L-alanine amidase n=1 Tax=Thalassobaculum litoreum DSM 18839 TaxID=1123362 RepID=A0A8G2BIE6_9PROT|nr:N-acetylmuramoyl-L-alanine amidase [Thalassobaculum litoreum]SDF42705.1 N-acetylmuramoyl-L-alanine amidase [Thalassobaculum litoreum DSM 18839]
MTRHAVRSAMPLDSQGAGIPALRLRFKAFLCLCVLGLVALATALPAVAAGVPVVSNLRIGNHPDKVRIVLDLDERVDFSIFLLPDPYRVVIDVPEVSFRLPESAGSRAVGPIAGWRYGQFRPGTSRVVIDADNPVQVKSAFVLPPSGAQQYRLVIDLTPATREAFLEASDASIERHVALSAPRVSPPPAAPAPLPKSDDRMTIVIDAGHGGVDPGAIGENGVYEKNIVLAAAQSLKAALEETGRYKAVLTRDSDSFIRLRERIAIARRVDADLFVSLHADSIKDGSLRGLSVYTLSENASDKEAEALATSENKADIVAGIDLTQQEPEVTNILIDLAQRRTMNYSARLAGYVVKEMERETKLLGRPHRFAGFAVLKAPDVPSVLVELGFLSNREDNRRLNDPTFRRKVAAGLTRAIDRYFQGVQSAFR